MSLKDKVESAINTMNKIVTVVTAGVQAGRWTAAKVAPLLKKISSLTGTLSDIASKLGGNVIEEAEAAAEAAPALEEVAEVGAEAAAMGVAVVV